MRHRRVQKSRHPIHIESELIWKPHPCSGLWSVRTCAEVPPDPTAMGSGAIAMGGAQDLSTPDKWAVDRTLLLFPGESVCLGPFGGVLCGSGFWGHVFAITGLHVPVAFLFGMFPLRGTHILLASHTTSSEGSYGLKEAVMLAKLSSAHKTRMPWLAPSMPARGGGGYFLSYYYAKFHGGNCPRLVELQLLCVWFVKPPFAWLDWGTIVLRGCSLLQLLLLHLPLAACQLQMHQSIRWK